MTHEKVLVPEMSEKAWDGARVTRKKPSRSGDWNRQYLRIPASSAAVVLWMRPVSGSSASRPLGVMKKVSRQPMSLAFWFIMPAKASLVPATCSAMAAAVSLWDSSIREYKRSSSRYCSPSRIFNCTSGMDAA